MESDRIGKLLSIAGEALSDVPSDGESFADGAFDALGDIISRRNGFYAFESALHVFPSGGVGLPGRSLQEWNDPSLWIDSYGGLVPPVLFFAEDVFGGQFAMMGGRVYSFDPETARLTDFADDVRMWSSEILARYDFATGYSISHAWQVENGVLPVGHRLIPRIPFCCGGDFVVGNMLLVESVAAMRYWGHFARKIAQLSDGAQLKFDPRIVDGLRCAGWLHGSAADCRCFDK